MYDIHHHILPDLDDGPKTAEDALSMARMAEDDGIQVVVTTPHASAIVKQGGTAQLESRLHRFNWEVQCHRLALRVVGGVEYLMEPDLPDRAARSEVLTLNGSRYVLVELHFTQFPLYTHDVLFRLQLGGLVPVIAHPERQATVQKDVGLVEQMVARGALMQVTAGSFLGVFGRPARECARRMLERGLIHVVASDAHSPRGPRTPLLSPAMEELDKQAGHHIARLLLTDNPRAIVENGDVTRPPAIHTPSIFGRLWPR